MQIVNMHDAKAHLAKLVDAAANGEEIIISKGGVPAVKLVPLALKKVERQFGMLKGKFRIADDFDEPLPDEVIRQFEGD